MKKNKFTLASFYLKWKKYFKLFFIKKIIFKFGSLLLFILQQKIITQKKILKFKLFLKKVIRKPEKTLKKLWITPIYIFNIALKSKGSRMGKGKGRKLINLIRLTPGTTFLEVSNIRTGRIFYFLFYLNNRFSNIFYFVTSYWLNFYLILKNSKSNFLNFYIR